MTVEHASEDDLPGIVAIYNEVITTSTAVFSDQPVSLERQRDWLRARHAREFPVLVARVDGAVAGFASYGEFRPWPGYRHTVEHSVYVATAQRRRGVGRRLLEQLLEHAGAAGVHVMIAGIDAENRPSLRLHEELGFERVGRLGEVARKFDRWLDLVFMQRTL
jgi:phosphinothricin acetyltransferase